MPSRLACCSSFVYGISLRAGVHSTHIHVHAVHANMFIVSRVTIFIKSLLPFIVLLLVQILSCITDIPLPGACVELG